MLRYDSKIWQIKWPRTKNVPLCPVKKFYLTTENFSARIQNNFIHQTVEAEITAMMPLQRACAGESQVRNKLSNGPLRVQSKVPVFYRNPVFCNVKAYVSCRGYVSILLSAWQSHEFKVAPRILCTVLFLYTIRP